MAINSNQEAVNQEAYQYAVEQAKAGTSVQAIRINLQAKGLTEEEANKLIVAARAEVRGVSSLNDSEEGGGGMGWLIYVAILVVINIILYVFDVGYIIY